MTIHRIVWVLIGSLAFVSGAHAKPDFLVLLHNQYRPAQGSALESAGCVACHTSPPEHNAYGAALKELMESANERTLSIALFEAAEGSDSDQDGWLNGDELRQGSLPGDAESHPESGPDAAPDALPDTTLGDPTWGQPSSPTGSTVVPPEPPVPPLIPLHSFHPAAVHFPIALFLFGALLDALGAWKRSKALRQAGYWNMLGGALSALIAVPTGIVAYLRLGFAFQHVALHLVLAVTGVLAMGAIVAYRRNHEAPTGRYWLALGLAVALVGAAGHFGAQLVFG